MKDTAILITTFLRDEALFKCVKSIRKYYSDIAIFVVDSGNPSDDKDELLSEYNCTHIRVPFDSGVCVARNEGLYQIPEKYKYIMILEDDIIFNVGTKLERLRQILEKRNQTGIVGCAIKRKRITSWENQHYEGNLRRDDDTICVEKIEKPRWANPKGLRYFYCDIVINVFMMRHDIWKNIKWDENYKTTPEHTDFFLLLKKNSDWKVAYTDKCELEHHDQVYKDAVYMAKRTRADGYRHLAEKWGVKYYSNSWHKQWGIDNPMGLYKYSKLKDAANEVTQPEVRKKSGVIAIGIKTFLREETLFKTIESIKKHFPYKYRLYIADDGPISHEKEYQYYELQQAGHRIINLPFNSGLSAGRNAILKEAKEDYILIMDDDISFTDSDSMRNMKKILDSDKNIGLCAGMIYQENGDYFGNHNYARGLKLDFIDGILYRVPAERKRYKVDGTGYLLADQVVNFFLAKKEIFNDVKWDNRIKIEYEHMDFFLELKKTEWKAAICLDTKLIHNRQKGVDSDYVRYRRSAPYHYFWGKHGIRNVINRFR